jgi:hypothetical protein
MNRRFVLVLAAVMLVSGLVWAADPPAKDTRGAPEVTGPWTGTWGPYMPTADPKSVPAKQLDCTVVRKGDVWQATFEGECGRPYKYTIKMDGRQAGAAVLFKGTADLGEKDGGVFDWIGRANDTEFTGFYTSARYAGVFRMTRPKK